jgi:dTDP-4-amino-4,6-dideoxygalactose transaminase
MNSNPEDDAVRRFADYIKAFLGDPAAFRGQHLRGGGAVAEFEQALSERCGFKFALATCNATTALLVTALAADLAGKDVVVPPNSWGGTYGPFEFAGAHLLWTKSDRNGNICPKALAEIISAKTAAVIAVDWNGIRHETQAIRAACDAHKVLYIEDTSHLPGVTCLPCEHSIADIQILSFGPGKPLSLGEGGALLTRSREIYENAVAISQHPERCVTESIEPNSSRPFLNARMHPLAAVIGSAMLGKPIDRHLSVGI